MSRFVLAKIVQARQIMSTLLPTKLSRYHYVAFFVFLIACGIVFSTGIAYAIDIAGSLIQAVSWMMLAIAKICIALTIFFLRFFITLASYNNYIDVSVVKLGWVMVRDVANMFFVVALLIIAFATILGLEQYEWKKGLVKLIIMAIFINFSNLIAQLIIDVAHVFTITFLNAISATAGGNLINMFKLEKIMSMVSGASLGNSKEEVTIEVLGASVVAVLFGIMSAVALGSYVIVMAIRVVVLWALIILSPLAYVLYAIPKGEKYAQEWWSEFTKYIIVAPVMVFFLWLAFATLGSGEILTEIKDSAGTVPLQNSDEQLKISLSEVSSWENMANYLIAMVFLMVGLKQTQATGVEGSGMVSGAVNFGKKVATIATGYAAGRWLVGKGTDVGKKAVGGAAYYFPKVGGHAWEQRAKTIGTDVKGWWYNKAAGMTPEVYAEQEALGKKKMGLSPGGLQIANDIARLEGQKKEARSNGGVTEDGDKLEDIETALDKAKAEAVKFGENEVTRQIQGLTVQIKNDTSKLNDENLSDEERTVVSQRIAENTEKKKTLSEDTEGKAASKEQEKIQDVIAGEQKLIASQASARGVVGWFASGGVKRQRRLGKSEKTAELAEKVAFKRIGSDSNFLTWMGKKDWDRNLKGILEAEEERSDGKTAEMSAAAKYTVLSMPRYKDGKWQNEKATVGEQVARHKIKAEITQESIKGIELKARVQLIQDDKAGSLLSQLATARVFAAQQQETVTGVEETELYKKHTASIKSSRDAIRDEVGKDEDMKKLGETIDKDRKEIEGLRGDLSENEKALANIPGDLSEAIVNARQERIKLDPEEEKKRAEIHSQALKKSVEGMKKGKNESGAEFEKRKTDKYKEVAGRLIKEKGLGDKVVVEGKEILGKQVPKTQVAILTDEDTAKIDKIKEDAQKESAKLQKTENETDEALEIRKKQSYQQLLASGITKEGLGDKVALKNGKIEAKEITVGLSPDEAKQVKQATRRAFEEAATLVQDPEESDEAYKAKQKKIFNETLLAETKDLQTKVDIKAPADIDEHLTAYTTKFQAGKEKKLVIDGKIEKDVENKQDYTKKYSVIIDQLDKQGRISAWQASRAQANREHSALFYRGTKQEMVDDAAQRHIWDKKNITTPTNALGEIIENMTNSMFKDMNYESVVEAFTGDLKRMEEQIAQNIKLSFEDRAISMAIQNKMVSEAWVDDGIIPVAELNEKRADALRARQALLKATTGREVSEEEAQKHIDRTSSAIGGMKLGESQRDDMGKILKTVVGDRAEGLVNNLKSPSELPAAIRELETILKRNIGEFSKVGSEMRNVFKTDNSAQVTTKLLGYLRGLGQGRKHTDIDELIGRIKK